MALKRSIFLAFKGHAQEGLSLHSVRKALKICQENDGFIAPFLDRMDP